MDGKDVEPVAQLGGWPDKQGDPSTWPGRFTRAGDAAMSLILSIAAHGDPSQTSLALLYPETCDGCDRPIYDRKPRQRYCVECVKARRRASQRRRYRIDAEYRAERLAHAQRYYHTRRQATA